MINTENLERFMQLAGTGKPEKDTYYRQVYEKISSGKRVVWNWPAFLFGPGWLLYRRLYLQHFLYSIVAILPTWCLLILYPRFDFVFLGQLVRDDFEMVFLLLFILLHILLGLFGSAIYYMKTVKKMNKHKLVNISIKATDSSTLLIGVILTFLSLFFYIPGVDFVALWIIYYLMDYKIYISFLSACNLIVYYSAIYISILCHFLKDEISLRRNCSGSHPSDKADSPNLSL